MEGRGLGRELISALADLPAAMLPALLLIGAMLYASWYWWLI